MSAPNRIPLFEPGRIVATPGAVEATTPHQLAGFLARHMRGDWGSVCEEDKQTNEAALIYGDRLLSAYPIDPDKPCEGFGDNTVWIINEADRSATTFLLPSEY